MAEFAYSARVAFAVPISNVALPITDGAFGFTLAQLARARIATMSAATAGIRFLYTGDAPTATFGYLLPVGSILEVVRNSNINNLVFLRAGGVDAVLTITLEW